jgi:hypothetical protein
VRRAIAFAAAILALGAAAPAANGDPATAPADRPAPCNQPVLARLAFLPGTWDVRVRTRLSGNPNDWEESVARSVIERRVRDCVLVERATGTRRGGPFEALRLFAARMGGDGLQLAVADSEHGPLLLYEGAAGDSGLAFTMPITTPAGDVLLRVRYDGIGPGGFVSRSERSTDGGRTWDLTGRAEYRRPPR